MMYNGIVEIVVSKITCEMKRKMKLRKEKRYLHTVYYNMYT